MPRQRYYANIHKKEKIRPLSEYSIKELQDYLLDSSPVSSLHDWSRETILARIIGGQLKDRPQELTEFICRYVEGSGEKRLEQRLDIVKRAAILIDHGYGKITADFEDLIAGDAIDYVKTYHLQEYSRN